MYIMIDEGYCIEKFTSLKDIVSYCENLTFQNGSIVTKGALSKLFKESDNVNVYLYDKEDKEEAIQSGSVRGVDWIYKFIKI